MEQKQNKKASFSAVFAENMEDRTEEKAIEMAENIKSAKGIVCFTNDDGKKYWGVLINNGLDTKDEEADT